MTHTLAQTLNIPWTNPSGSPTITQVQGNLNLPGKGGNVTLGDILSHALEYIFYFAGIALLLMLLSSGFTFITSAGDPKKLEKAKGALTNALVGFLILFAAFWIVQIAGIIFGIETIRFIFPW